LIINGDMQIAQRGTSETGLGLNQGYFTVDRFRFNEFGSSQTFRFTMSQETDSPTGQGFNKSLKIETTTVESSLGSGNGLAIQHRIEGQNLQMLKKGTSDAESLTVSFWVKSAKTGTYILELFDFDNLRQISQAYTIDSANTWEKKVLSFAGDTTGALGNDSGTGLSLAFWLCAGSDYSSGTLNTSWASSTNANRVVGQVNLADSTSNDWYITGVQLEVGTFDANSIPPFQFEDRGTSLARCQRYYEKTYNLDVDPGTGSNPVGRYQFYSYGLDDNQRFPIRYHTRKRAAPTIVAYSSADGTSGKASNGGGTNYTVTSDSIGESGFGLKGAGGTQDGFFVHFTFESEL
jgi:hypothetical protein